MLRGRTRISYDWSSRLGQMVWACPSDCFGEPSLGSLASDYMNPTPYIWYNEAPKTNEADNEHSITMKINYALPFRVLFAVIAASLLSTADAQWVQRADFPGEARLWPSCFAIGDKIYYGGGCTSEPGGYEPVDDFWMFDTGSNNWTERAPLPDGGIFASASFAIGNKGYVATGGIDAMGSTSNNIWEYDPVADAWTIKAPLPASPRRYSAGFAIGAYGYVAAGQNGSTPLSDLWRYDPTGNSWLQMSSFSGAGEQQFSFVIGTDAYVGGSYGVLPVWKYNSSNDSWLQRANHPVAIGAVFTLDGSGYLISPLGSYTYSPATDVWSTVSGPSSFEFFGATGVTVSSSGYVVAGSDASVWELTGTTAGFNGNRRSMSELSVFPNPTNGGLVLQLPPQAKARSISILDATSRVVLTQPITNIFSISVDLSGHENGLYFLQVRFADGTQAVERIVKE